MRAHLEDDGGRDAVAEELVELGADVHDALGRLFLHDHVPDLVAVRLPVRLRDRERLVEVRPVRTSALQLRSRRGGGGGETDDCILSASRTRRALRRFPFASSTMSCATLSGTSKPSFLPTYRRTSIIYTTTQANDAARQHQRALTRATRARPLTSPSSGAATRTRRQRLLMGAIRREVELAQRMMRIFDIYFSIVRRSAACASRVSESASLMMTTARPRHVSTVRGGRRREAADL